MSAHPQAKQFLRKAFQLGGAGELPHKAVVLDIGGGSGAAGEVLRAAYPGKAFKYANVDVDEALLGKRGFLERVHASRLSPVWLKRALAQRIPIKIKADRSQLPFADSSVDMALYAFPAASLVPASMPREHRLDRYFLPLVESLRVLKKGSCVMLIRRSTKENLTRISRQVRQLVGSLGVGREVALQITPTPKELYREFVNYDPNSLPSHLCLQVIKKTSAAGKDTKIAKWTDDVRLVISRAMAENEE